LSAYGLDVADLQLQARASPRHVQLERLTARVAGARLSATGRAAMGGPLDLQVTSESIPLRGMTITPHRMALDGRVKLDLTGSGTLAAPQVHGQIQLNGVQASGVAVGTGALSFTLTGHRLSFTTAGLQSLSLNGSVALDEALPAQIRLEMRGLDPGQIAAQLAGNPDAELSGDLSGTIEIRGPLRFLPHLTGLMTLERVRVRSNGVEVSNPAPWRCRLEQGVLRFETVQLQAQGARLEVRGSADVVHERLDIAIRGNSPLAIVGTHLPGLRFQQGTVDAQVNIRGRLSQPAFDGQVLLKDGAIYIAAINDNLSRLGGEILFADQTIAIQSLQGQLAGGELGVSGEVRLRGYHLHDMRITTQANQIRLRYPAGFFTMLDAALVISGNSTQQLIAGEVSLNGARYRRDFELASLLQQFRQRALEPPPMAQDRLQLDIRVSARDAVRVENRLAKLQLQPDLNVRGSAYRPIVLGRTEIDKGTADVAGTRFSAISGSIDFLNPTRTEPFFDIAADTQKSGYQIHVVATGTPHHIDLQLTSEPPLAEPDILALLTVGATGQAVTTGLTTVLPGHVTAFLTGRIAEEIGRGVGGLVGVDRLDIEPLIGGAQRVGGPKVTVGKDISKNLSVTYATIVGSTQEDTVTMEYRFTDNISILGVRDERGDVGVDVKYSIRFE
jgi:translocation and assembly module TamB